MKGWYGNSYNHGLASRGIKTKASNIKQNHTYLYHVTEESKVESILKNGLIPKNDPHLEKKVVNLADKEKVKMFEAFLLQGNWLINTKILKVKVNLEELEKVGDGWWTSNKKIKPENIIVEHGMEWKHDMEE